MQLNDYVRIRITDDLKRDLEMLADVAEANLSKFCRGALEFYVFCWTERHKSPYFKMLWNEFVLDKSGLPEEE